MKYHLEKIFGGFLCSLMVGCVSSKSDFCDLPQDWLVGQFIDFSISTDSSDVGFSVYIPDPQVSRAMIYENTFVAPRQLIQQADRNGDLVVLMEADTNNAERDLVVQYLVASTCLSTSAFVNH